MNSSRPSPAERAAAELELRRRRSGGTRGRYDWPRHARPEQLPPGGDWRTWLVIAGRGFGKTRTGAEWVRSLVESGGARRVALVGATAADARDVMIEGESGLLAVCPPWDKPHYEPSKRRLTWPDGATATAYSADEPERLRGPQHDAAWCLAGDTPVLMADGSWRPLAAVRVGDMVTTRVGPRRVTGSAMTRRNSEVFRLELVDGRGIIGTADHRIMAASGQWVPIASLSAGQFVCVSSAWNGAATPGTSTAVAITTRDGPGCMSRCGKRRTARFQRGITSITSTGTSSTTGSRICNSCRTANTAECTTRRNSVRTWPGRERIRLLRAAKPENAVSHNACCPVSFVAGRTVVAPKYLRVIVRRLVLRGRDRALSRASRGAASIAAYLTRRLSGRSVIARNAATISRPKLGRKPGPFGTSHVRTAVRCFRAPDRTPDSAVGNAHSTTTLEIASVRSLAGRVNVYDIAVEDAREFFANGILVHNCDEVGSWRRPAAYDNLMLGLRIGADPRVCVTTTPRPTKLVQTLLGAGTTARTGGSSYDNRANLAPQFFEQIVARYEGTRLGRQEIHAEYLEITEGAWFTTFDPARNVTADAEYDPRFPARCAVDCGVSRHTGAVFYQVRESGPYRWKINVFADYHAVDLMSDVNAAAVREVAAGRCGGSLERVRLDPAATARTGVGPAAYGEYERVFGPRVLGYWPQHPVADGLDQVEILLGSESRDADLTIHPRCTHLIAAFNGYSREYRGGEWMAWPDPLQHPHEDLMDALRGGVRDAMPEGRKPQPKFTWRPGRSVL